MKPAQKMVAEAVARMLERNYGAELGAQHARQKAQAVNGFMQAGRLVADWQTIYQHAAELLEAKSTAGPEVST